MKKAALLLLVPGAIALAQMPSGHEWIHTLSLELRARGLVLLDLHTTAEGTRRYYAISAEELARCPEWDGNGDPPLRLSQAVALARTHLGKRHREHEQFNFISGRFSSTGTEPYPKRWYYALDFTVNAPANSPSESEHETVLPGHAIETFEVYMMFDGSIIEPTPVEEASANKNVEAALFSAARKAVPGEIATDQLITALDAGLWNSNRTAVAVSTAKPEASVVFVFLRQTDGTYLPADASGVEDGNFGKLGRPRTDYDRFETTPVEWLHRNDGLFQVRMRTRAWRGGQRYTVSEPLIIRPDGTVLHR